MTEEKPQGLTGFTTKTQRLLDYINAMSCDIVPPAKLIGKELGVTPAMIRLRLKQWAKVGFKVIKTGKVYLVKRNCPKCTDPAVTMTGYDFTFSCGNFVIYATCVKCGLRYRSQNNGSFELSKYQSTQNGLAKLYEQS